MTERQDPQEYEIPKIVLAWRWISQRSWDVVILRIYDQIMRLITGAPLQQYSEITPVLHVGGQQYEKGLEAMKERGITAIVNMRRSDDRRIKADLPAYLHLSTPDNGPPRVEDLQRGVEFMQQEIDKGGAVYVHCGVGVGRAPTMAAAYLVSTGMTPDEAWKTLREKRPFIFPNGRQKASLQQFADSLKK